MYEHIELNPKTRTPWSDSIVPRTIPLKTVVVDVFKIITVAKKKVESLIILVYALFSMALLPYLAIT